MKPPVRTKSVGTKVSEAEFAMLEERARAAGLTLSEWVRDVLLAAPVEPGAELAGEIVLAELLALRSLFLNLHYRAGKELTEAELRGLIERADATKMQRAQERLQALARPARRPRRPNRRRSQSMAEWGRKAYSKPWPSRTPVWTVAAILLSVVFFAGMLTWEYEGSWTAAKRLYLSDYLKSGARGKASATAASKYTLLEAVVGKDQRLVLGDEIERVPDVDGRPGYRLTDEGVKDGVARLEWVTGTFNDRGLHRVMSEAVYADHESWEFYRRPVYLSVAFFIAALFVAIPKDRKRRLIWKHGRRLRGPELVTTAEFNTKLGRSKGLRVELPDGVMFVNEEQSWYDKTFHNSLSRWVRVPRDREAMHFLIVGDSGTGKSAAIRQILSQVWERGEAAIVYDPAMEYLPQFYNAARGDVVLNPLDARCPFWTPGDEVPHEAEALTLAASLFPDQGRENRFFVEAPRKIFAHLIKW